MREIVFPNAKINLGLRVINKREDGFHNLETIFYPIDTSDILEIVESPDKITPSKMIQYGIEYPGNPNDNLCMKAYNLLSSCYDLPRIEIHLLKKIPVGAGLGGGSSDAAFTIMLLNNMYKLNLTKQELIHFASLLGSDCPFFIYNNPMLGTGKGEILSPIDISILKEYEIRLISPDIFVSTADAYKGIITRENRLKNGEVFNNMPLEDIVKMPVEEWKYYLENDFENTVFLKYPQLKEIKDEIYAQGAIYASMSGSGSTMFGIFKK